MGDTGSLALGAALAGMAVVTGTEILLLLIGGLFVVEALSVMIQVFSFRFFHRRVFLMTPIHHHFELQGLVGDEDHRAVLDRQRPSSRRRASPSTTCSFNQGITGR